MRRCDHTGLGLDAFLGLFGANDKCWPKEMRNLGTTGPSVQVWFFLFEDGKATLRSLFKNHFEMFAAGYGRGECLGGQLNAQFLLFGVAEVELFDVEGAVFD